MRYTVLVNDNFHYMNETELLTEGEFDTEEAAIARAQEIVDKCLADLYSKLSKHQKPGSVLTFDELYGQYKSFGEDPFVVTEDSTVCFSGWNYAKERCAEIITSSNPDK